MGKKICPHCGRFMRRIYGIGTLIGCLLTAGVWILALPFYSKECSACIAEATRLENQSSETPKSKPFYFWDTKKKWYMRWQVWAVVVLVILVNMSDTVIYETSEPQSPEQLESGRDESDARMYAKHFVEKSLKSPSTAKWSSYGETGVAIMTDEQGNKIKDRWHVSGYVDAQNSFGAMIRQKWYVAMQKSGDTWHLLDMRFE